MEYIYNYILQIDTLQEALILYALFVCLFIHLPFYLFFRREEKKWK